MRGRGRGGATAAMTRRYGRAPGRAAGQPPGAGWGSPHPRFRSDAARAGTPARRRRCGHGAAVRRRPSRHGLPGAEHRPRAPRLERHHAPARRRPHGARRHGRLRAALAAPRGARRPRHRAGGGDRRAAHARPLRPRRQRPAVLAGAALDLRRRPRLGVRAAAGLRRGAGAPRRRPRRRSADAADRRRRRGAARRRGDRRARPHARLAGLPRRRRRGARPLRRRRREEPRRARVGRGRHDRGPRRERGVGAPPARPLARRARHRARARPRPAAARRCGRPARVRGVAARRRRGVVRRRARRPDAVRPERRRMSAGDAVPGGATDCHVHVFGPYERFPLAPERPYTPPEASVDDLRAMRAALRIERAVVVAASPYGTQNGALLAAVRALGGAGRGVVALDPDREVDLETMHAAGVRGARVNLASVGASDPQAAEAALHRTAEQVAPLGWHVDLHARLDVIAALRGAIERVPGPIVIDHFGYADPAAGPDQPGFAALCELAAAGRAYVKLSAPERLPGGDPDHPGVAALARALLDAAPDRMLWASDWPHTGGGPHGGGARDADETEPFRAVDDARALDRLREWTRDERELRRVLVENPARLYGFAN